MAWPSSWSSPPGRRRSATPCWIHPSGWRPGCSTTTPTPTTSSPARSSTASPRATSPGTTSSTTSRCTGSRAPAPRPPGGTGSSDGLRPQPVRPARLRRRSRFRSASRTSPVRSSLLRAAGSRWCSPASATSTSPTGAATSPPGRSPSSSRPRCERRSARCVSGGGVMSTAGDTTTDIRTFRTDIADEQIDDLRRRVAATRWPSKELVDDRSQGVQLATMKELTRYWTTEYDWRACEARLNALPQFITEIDGVDIHFIHVRSPHEDALPLIMTHGWPGSVVERLDTVGPLTDPTAHGGKPEDAFHLVLPSLPGYGFSGEPTEVGWDLGRTGRAWAELMRRLGYPRYVAQGGDRGAVVTAAMPRQPPEGLLGVHLNVLTAVVVPGVADQLPTESGKERAAHDALNTFTTDGSGYFLEMA